MKRTFCLIILLIISLSLIPPGVSAKTSGICGENLTWTLSEDGVLTISGNGNMPNWTNSADVPWDLDREIITSIVIENGSANISDNAFKSCPNLKSVIIPDSVKKIGKYAFISCIGLDNITVPENVTNIGNGAFRSCGGLEINVAKNNPNYSSVEGVLFNKNKTTLIAYSKDRTQPSYTVPNYVTYIDNNAFSGCSKLTDLTIPQNVTKIGDFAFNGCTSIKNITIPYGITKIGTYTFNSCTALSCVSMQGSIASIGSNAFNGCTKLTDVYYGGTATQWYSADISTENNNYLSNSTMHYIGKTKYNVENISYTNDKSTVCVKGYVKNESESALSGKLIYALYDSDGMLKSCVSTNIEAFEAGKTEMKDLSLGCTAQPGDKIRAYIWIDNKPLSYISEKRIS